MKAVAISCVQNEVDIVEAFVRHALAFASHLVVLDNASSDGTLAVLRKLQGEGLPLDVVEDTTMGVYQSQRMTRLMREYAIGRHNADWVLPLDADEFVVVLGGGVLVPDGTPSNRPMRLFWRSYVPDETDDVAELNPVVRLRHRLVAEGTPSKVWVPAALAARPDAVIAQGSHALLLAGRACEAAESRHACLAHFPIRSRGQFVAKTVIGQLQYEVMAARDPGWGCHWRDRFEWLKRDPEDFLNHVSRTARNYGLHPSAKVASMPALVEDPLPYRGGPLRYTPPLREDVQMWPPILCYVQALAREYALLKAALQENDRLSTEQAGDIQAMIRRLADVTRDLRERLVAMEWQLHHSILEREALCRSITFQVGRLVTAPVRYLRRCWLAWRRSGAAAP